MKLDAQVQRFNIRISNYVSTVDSKGYRSVVKMISQGQTDIDIISQLVEEIELQQRQRDAAQQKMTALCKEWFPEQSPEPTDHTGRERTQRNLDNCRSRHRHEPGSRHRRNWWHGWG